jgi:hypothetical protein
MDNMERVAIVLDLENLVGPGSYSRCRGEVSDAIPGILAGRTAVSLVGYCARALQKVMAFDLADLGVRVFGHADPRPDAADYLILNYLQTALPASATTVVVGSGDHIFAPAAADLRGRGMRVEVAARPGTLAASLYRECTRWHPVGDSQIVTAPAIHRLSIAA